MEIVCHTAVLREIRYKGILYPSPDDKLINGMDQKRCGSPTESITLKDQANAPKLVCDEEEHNKVNMLQGFKGYYNCLIMLFY